MLIDRIQDFKVIKLLQEKKKDINLKDTITFERMLQEKEYRVEQIKESLASLKVHLNHLAYSFTIVEGLFLWEVNYKLNRLAYTGIPEVDLEKGKVTLTLSRKKSHDLTNGVQVANIEQAIAQLEGYENLRLRELYRYKTVYKEKKIFNQITRWIEIEIR